MNKIRVITDKIRGTRTEQKNLYMIIWERVANSGIVYCWAKNEERALSNWGFSPAFVKHTIVKINPKELPMTYGVSK